MISNEELLNEDEEDISTEIYSDEYVQCFDENLLILREDQESICEIQIKNNETKKLTGRLNETVHILDESTGSQSTEIISLNDQVLTALTEMITGFQLKYKRKNNNLYFKTHLFPEILTIYYFKIKNGEENDVIKTFCRKIFNELTEFAFFRFSTRKEMFEGQIKVKTWMIEFLINKKACPNSYTSLYTILVALLELKFKKTKQIYKYEDINVKSIKFDHSNFFARGR